MKINKGGKCSIDCETLPPSKLLRYRGSRSISPFAQEVYLPHPSGDMHLGLDTLGTREILYFLLSVCAPSR